jgi:WD40 repeat protein
MAGAQDLVDQFLQASVAAEQAQQRAEARRRRQITTFLVGGLVIVSLLAGIASWLAFRTNRQASDLQVAATTEAQQAQRLEAAATTDALRLNALSTSQAETALERDTAVAEGLRADQQTLLALSRQLVVQATNQLDDDFMLALLLGAQASRYADTGEARDVLLSAVSRGSRLTRFLLGQSGRVLDLVLDPQGKLLALTRCDAQQPGYLPSNCRENDLYMWDLDSGQAQAPPITDYAGSLSSWDLSPDGRVAALASCGVVSQGDDGTFCQMGGIRLWDPQTGQPLGEILEGQTSWVESMAFHPDGQLLASSHCLRYGPTNVNECTHNEIRLWDLVRGAPKATLTGYGPEAHNLTFSHDGQTLASGRDAIILRNAETGDRIRRLVLEDGSEITSIAFSPDDQTLAAATADYDISLWQVQQDTPIDTFRKGHVDEITGLAFSPDGQLLASASADGTIVLWDVATRKLREGPLRGHLSAVSSLLFAGEGTTLISGALDGAVILWDVTPRDPLRELLASVRTRVTSLATRENEPSLASGLADGTILLWDLSARQEVGEPLAGHEDGIRALAFSPSGQILASGSADETIILWDVASHTRLGPPLAGQAFRVVSLAFSPDGQTLASGGTGSIFLWDLTAEPPVREILRRGSGWVQGLAFSPNLEAPLLASAGLGGSDILLWDLATRQLLNRPGMEQPGVVWDIAFHPSRPLLASSGENITLWDVETSEPVGAPLTGHTATVLSVAFSPDGRTLASGSRDDSIILWDVDAQRMLGEPLTGHTREVQSVVFSRDGRLLVSGSDDGTIRLWDLDLDAWRTRACRIANRNLTREEWDLFVGSNVAYQCTCPELPPGEGVPPDACQEEDQP